MRNVSSSMLKKCIFMDLEEFKDLINNVTGGLKRVKYEPDGIYYEDTDEAEEVETYWNEHITETLSKYFDVKVTSIHADDCEYVGVWICYKDENEKITLDKDISIIDATFVSVWDCGRTTLESPCKVNINTKQILDIRPANNIEDVCTLDEEKVIINGKSYPASNENDAEEDYYWY